MPDEGLGRFALLASAIAGRLVDVTGADPDQPSWTDGATVFVDGEASRMDQLRRVAVQAALLSAGSLDVDIMAGLRRPAVARRYLAIEGHRALAAHEALLPQAARRLIDHGMAARSDSPAASLALATSREDIAEPPSAFGAIRPKHILTVGRHLEEMAVEIRQPFPRDQMLRELDDG